MSAGLKWHAYEPASSSSDLAELVEAVKRDRRSALFG
jgi:hypothetical protein